MNRRSRSLVQRITEEDRIKRLQAQYKIKIKVIQSEIGQLTADVKNNGTIKNFNPNSPVNPFVSFVCFVVKSPIN